MIYQNSVKKIPSPATRGTNSHKLLFSCLHLAVEVSLASSFPPPRHRGSCCLKIRRNQQLVTFWTPIMSYLLDLTLTKHSLAHILTYSVASSVSTSPHHHHHHQYRTIPFHNFLCSLMSAVRLFHFTILNFQILSCLTTLYDPPLTTAARRFAPYCLPQPSTEIHHIKFSLKSVTVHYNL